MNFGALVMKAVGLFLMLDAALALVLGRRYISLGLSYAPGWYRRLILRILELPPPALLALELAEFSLGLFLFLLAGRL
ncbi:hypothetical protein [Candidatus Pyrohabitans sp.]